MCQIGLGDVFDVLPFDSSRAIAAIRSWGPNEQMSDERLTVKLALLLTIGTARQPRDLARIVDSSVTIMEDGRVMYRLMRDGMLSAAQFVKPIQGDDLVLCPCRCWSEYSRRRPQLLDAMAEKRDRFFVFRGGEVDGRVLYRGGEGFRRLILLPLFFSWVANVNSVIDVHFLFGCSIFLPEYLRICQKNPLGWEEGKESN